MHEYATVSSSSYDPASLAAKLTEKSADGWSVVAIVPTGGDVTAFLSRESTGTSMSAKAAVEPASAAVAEPMIDVVAEPAPQPIVEVSPIIVASVPTPEPVVEPAGWAVAPEPAAPTLPQVQPAPVPAPVVAPAAVAPAVPAGWYADPAGRFELRYWDGTTWTEHVSRAGQQFTDPPVA